MAEASNIEWCDATFNPWWGCAEVSPGCGNCYARTWAAFTRATQQLWPAKGAAGKGQQHNFMITSNANWRRPLRWARLAREGKLPDGTENVDGHRPRIFTASMSDVFEDHPALEEPRQRLFDLIAQTPELDWLVLTKRPEIARDWLRNYYGWVRAGSEPQPNVWMGTSIENARYTWRADVLREIPAAVRFISAEPLLGSLYETHVPAYSARPGHSHKRALDLSGIDWVIIGGESGPGARPFHLEHAIEIIGHATAESYHRTDFNNDDAVAVFVKQLGAKPVFASALGGFQVELELTDRKGGVMDEWPEDLRIREFPRSAVPV